MGELIIDGSVNGLILIGFCGSCTLLVHAHVRVVF